STCCAPPASPPTGFMTPASARAATAPCFIRTAAKAKAVDAIWPWSRNDDRRAVAPADADAPPRLQSHLDQRDRHLRPHRRADALRLQAVGRPLRDPPSLAADAHLRGLHAAQTGPDPGPRRSRR